MKFKLTLNPYGTFKGRKDVFQQWDIIDPSSRYRAVIKWIKQTIDKLDSNYEFILYPEFSSSGRIHFHGTVEPQLHSSLFETMLDLSTNLHNIDQTFKLEPVHPSEEETIEEALSEWYIYCTKDRLDNETISKEYGFNYPIRSRILFKSGGVPEEP